MGRICGIVIAWFVFSCSLSAAAQNVSPASVDNYVAAEMAKQRIPGLELGVYRDGKL